MGHRMEIFTDASTANDIISVSRQFNIDAQVWKGRRGGEKRIDMKVGGEEMFIKFFIRSQTLRRIY